MHVILAYRFYPLMLLNFFFLQLVEELLPGNPNAQPALKLAVFVHDLVGRQFGLDLGCMVCFGADGESTLKGCRTGIVQQLIKLEGVNRQLCMFLLLAISLCLSLSLYF